MRSTIRPLLLALVMVGSAGGEGWLRPEVPDRSADASGHMSAPAYVHVVTHEHGQEVWTRVPANAAASFLLNPCQDFENIWIQPGRSIVVPNVRHECRVDAAQQIGSNRVPWPSPIIIYVRRGVPVTVVEVGP